MNKPVKVKLKKKAGEASDEGAAEPGNAPGSQGGGSGSGGVSGHEETAVGFDFIKYRLAWYGISALLIVPGLVMMVLSMMTYDTHTPLKLGIDFTGGTMLEYAFEKELTQSDLPVIQASLNQLGLGDSVIQIQHPKEHMTVNTATVSTELQTDSHATTEEAEAVDVNGLPVMPKADKASDDRSITQVIEDLNKDGKAENLKNAAFDVSTLVSIRTRDLSTEQTVTLQKSLTDQFGRFALLQKNRVGPVLAKEILIKGSLALLLAYALIVVYLTWRFQLDYAVFAMVALLHDTIFMVGAFAILGWFFGVEVNAMFVTAILTVIGFSVHDTIVVYDRIRENIRVFYTRKWSIKDIINISLNQTLARSINTSLTTLAVLLALYLFGGESTQTFVLAMMLGIAVGTYSSIFVAGCMLASWRQRSEEAQPQPA